MKFASFFYIIVLGGESVSNREEILNLFRKILSSLLCINMETSDESLKEKSLKYINEFENEYKSYYNFKKYFIDNTIEIIDFCNECYQDKDVFDYAEDVEYGLRELINLSNKKDDNMNF